jgi:hypothetical protein
MVVPRWRTESSTGVFPFPTGLQLEARDRRDGGQRLAAESERRHPDQIGRRADLARRVALQRKLRVVAIHPRTVVAHANQRLAAILQLDADGTGAGIEGVLDQLFDDGRRPLDDFARRDLVGDVAGKYLDARAREHTHSPEISPPRTQPWIPSERYTSTQGP